MASASAPGTPARTTRFYLESLVEGGRQLRRIAVHPLPFRVGRLTGLALSLASDSVSKEHAELFLRDGALHVRDLGSKNGTFVNSERVGEAPLREGDILHFAQVEFRVGRQEIDEADEQALEPSTVSLADMKLPASVRGRGARAARSCSRAAGDLGVPAHREPAERRARRLRGARARAAPATARGADGPLQDRDRD